MPSVRNGPVTIHYRVRGAGEPLVLLHGYTASSADWKAQWDALDRRCIAIDLRGHGASTIAPRSDYSLPAMAADVLAVLDAEGFEAVDLVGHSLGGMIATHLLATAPQRLLRVIFHDTTPLPPDPARRATLMAQLADLYASDADPIMLGGRSAAREAAIGCAELQRDMPSYADAIRGHPIKALVIWGSEDSTNIRRGSAAYLELLPNARGVTIPGAGHVPHLTHPAEFNAALNAFLDEPV